MKNLNKYFKNRLKLLLFLTISLQLYGQVENVENLMTRRFLSCVDVLHNVSWLIPEFHERGSRDTLQAIIAYWESRCNFSEESMRINIKTLLSIDDNTFNENILSDRQITGMSQVAQHGNERIFRTGWGFYPFDNESYERLRNFVATLSTTLLETKELSAVERFFLHIFANDFEQASQMLYSDELDGTRIKGLYLQEKKAREEAVHFHNNWMLGVWIPQDNLGLLGVHPFIGYRFGVKYKKLTADISLGLKFGKSPNTYQVYKDGIIWDTNHFFGGYIGLDTGYELFRFKNNSIDLIGGIAYSGFNTLNEKNNDCCACCSNNNKISHSINSLNLNIGLGYKFHFKRQRFNQRYLGIDIKYNFVNFKNPHGTNLDGNVFTVNLILGNVIGDLFNVF